MYNRTVLIKKAAELPKGSVERIALLKMAMGPAFGNNVKAVKDHLINNGGESDLLKMWGSVCSQLGLPDAFKNVKFDQDVRSPVPPEIAWAVGPLSARSYVVPVRARGVYKCEYSIRVYLANSNGLSCGNFMDPFKVTFDMDMSGQIITPFKIVK